MEKELRCLHCKEDFYLYDDLQWHIENEHTYGDKFYSIIEDCEETFAWEDFTTFNEHAREKHPEENIQIGYSCNECGKLFSTQELEMQHYKLEHS